MNQIINKVLILTILIPILVLNNTGSASQAEPVHNKEESIFIGEKSIAGISVLLENNSNEKVNDYFESKYYIKGIPLEKELQEYIYNQSVKHDIDYYLVLACIEKESGYQNKISKDGHDYGICQIRDVNHESLNNELGYTLNYMNEYDNVLACITMLSDLMLKYPSYNLHCLLMSYNYGESGAKRQFSKGIYSSINSRKTMKIYEELKLMKGDYKYE